MYDNDSILAWSSDPARVTTQQIAAELREGARAIHRPTTKKRQPRLSTGKRYPVTVTTVEQRALAVVEASLGTVTVLCACPAREGVHEWDITGPVFCRPTPLAPTH